VPLAALGLILIAAVLHAGWNLLIKQAKQKQVLFWWALITGSLCFSFLLFTGAPLPARAWPYVLASAFMEALYFVALTWAYDIDDFSLIYPIARGAAPALLALWATLFLNDPPHGAGIVGIALLVLGLIITGSSPLWSRSTGRNFSTKGILAALATALCISIYTTIDGAAVRFVPPLPYTVLILGLSAVLATPVVVLRYGTRAMLTEWRVNRRRIILVGLAALVTYILVLQAYTISHVSYAGAVREVSVVFAALLGWRWLDESFGLARTIGAICIFAGIVVIAVLG
jgi:drug/metabolite transporter (DMT)-like permease